MKKIKFKIEYVPLTDAQIERHKDFDQLMAAYTAHPKPNWKTRIFGNKFLLYMGGIMTGALVTATLWWSTTQFDKKEVALNQHQTTQEIIHNQNSDADNSAREDLNVPDQKKNSSALKNSDAEKPAPVNSFQQVSKYDNPNAEAKSPEKKSSSVDTKIEGPRKEQSSSVKSFVFEKNGSKTSENKTHPEESKTKDEVQDGFQLNEETVAIKDSIESLLPASKIEGEQSSSLNIKNTIDSLLIPDFSSRNSSADSSHNKIETFDSTIYDQQSVFADTNFIATPGDSSKKKNAIALPKIDLNDEWDASKNAVTKIADSVGRKTGGFFTKLFSRHSANEKAPKEEKAIPENPPMDTFQHHLVQICFVSPLSSDGLNAKQYSYNFSFNVLQGYTGALDGVEIGGLANLEKGYVKGVQFAGLTNFAMGDVSGVQFGGLVNYGKKLTGAQFGGLVNSASGDVRGLQAAGIVNFAKGTLNGIQLGGVLNLSAGNNPSYSWQLGGVGNISFGKINGGQIAGVFNLSNEQHGFQAGLINVSKKMHGFQLGLINIADTLDGDALGLISISKNGIHNVDLFGSEILYGNVALKLGSPHIYTLFAVGAAPVNNTVRFGFGLGVGGHTSFGKGFLNIDGICWSIHNDSLRDWNGVNLWNQIRLTGGYQFAKGVAVYAGPTANVQVFDVQYESIAPYKIYEHYGNTNVTGWIGFVLGVQFF